METDAEAELIVDEKARGSAAAPPRTAVCADAAPTVAGKGWPADMAGIVGIACTPRASAARMGAWPWPCARAAGRGAGGGAVQAVEAGAAFSTGGAGSARNANARAIGTAGRRRAVSRLVSAGPTNSTPSRRAKRRSTATARSCVAASK